MHSAADGGKEVLPAVDVLLVGGASGLLVRQILELQAQERDLLLLRGGGFEGIQFAGLAAPVYRAVQTVLTQGVYVGGQLRIGGLHGIAALPHTVLHPLDAGGVKDIVVKILLLPNEKI